MMPLLDDIEVAALARDGWRKQRIKDIALEILLSKNPRRGEGMAPSSVALPPPPRLQLEIF